MSGTSLVRIGMQVRHRDGKRGHVVDHTRGVLVRVVWDNSTVGPAHPADLTRAHCEGPPLWAEDTR